MLAAFDFGITNTDVIINVDEKNSYYTFLSEPVNNQFIDKIFKIFLTALINID